MTSLNDVINGAKAGDVTQNAGRLLGEANYIWEVLDEYKSKVEI